MAQHLRGNPVRRVVAFLVVGLFVVEGTPEDVLSDTMEVIPTHGYNVATWQGNGVTYELVTDMDEGEIRRMVGEPGGR